MIPIDRGEGGAPVLSSKLRPKTGSLAPSADSLRDLSSKIVRLELTRAFLHFGVSSALIHGLRLMMIFFADSIGLVSGLKLLLLRFTEVLCACIL